MIVPTLMAEAEERGLIQRGDGGILARLSRFRAAKLAALPTGMINRYVTVAFSAEMVGQDGLELLDLENLQEANGSVAYSPAATTFFALNVRRQDPAALAYLREFSVDGAVPYVVPIDVFESAWPLWNLALADVLDGEALALCQPHLDLLEGAWVSGKGIASVSGLAFTDGDATGMTYEVLTRLGRRVDLEGVLWYEEDKLFRCYRLEANPSISTNVHVLGALRQAGFSWRHGPVRKILEFLRRTQTLQMFWFDKWHASPYYTTAHAIIHCAGLEDDLLHDAVYWILATQNRDGSWGYYMPTAEETAYCLQALTIWRRKGYQVPAEVLKRGAVWLADHMDPPYPPLWIGKAMYCPILVVRSSVLSALALAEQG
jgi:halimadienyl-diphosphate synthase